jgi:hypothetical protein
MMKKKTYIQLLACTLFSLSACTENEMIRFSEPPAVYFLTFGNDGTWAPAYDKEVTTTCNFGAIHDRWDVTVDTLEFCLQLEGAIQEQPLVIRLKVEEVEGYPAGEVLLAEGYILPAGETRVTVPVIINSPVTKNVLHRVKLAIDHERSGLAEGIAILQHVTLDIENSFTLEDVGCDAATWESLVQPALGAFSNNRLRFIAYAFYTTAPALFNTYFSYLRIGYASLVKSTITNKLAEYNAAHPDAPVLDDDGSPLVF